jgi:hypothetical protein
VTDTFTLTARADGDNDAVRLVACNVFGAVARLTPTERKRRVTNGVQPGSVAVLGPELVDLLCSASLTFGSVRSLRRADPRHPPGLKPDAAAAARDLVRRLEANFLLATTPREILIFDVARERGVGAPSL